MKAEEAKQNAIDSCHLEIIEVYAKILTESNKGNVSAKFTDLKSGTISELLLDGYKVRIRGANNTIVSTEIYWDSQEPITKVFTKDETNQKSS